jgi:hypothetical protein
MMDRGYSKPQLRRMLRDRIAKAIPEGSGAEIKNLCDALYVLEGKGQPAQAGSTGPKALTVRFIGDAEDYSL